MTSDTLNFNSKSPVKTYSWQQLQSHCESLKTLNTTELFEKDNDRFNKYSVFEKGLLFDYSKNKITDETLTLLHSIAEELELKEAIEAMFKGEKINETEKREVLHVNLRKNPEDLSSEFREVHEILEKIKKFTHQLHTGEWKGHTGKEITQIINIGIGGSFLGPQMVCEALKSHRKEGMEVYFAANVDGHEMHDILEKINPETSLFLIASKTFTTQETLANAHTARNWFLKNGGDEGAIKKHFVAISTNVPEVQKFGIPEENMFRFWDWVGGRFSMWSAIGLSIACYLGYEAFDELLEGAREMDNHFRLQPFEKNIPVLMGLISFWNINFLNAEAEAVLPYHQHLKYLPSYLQQLVMESNGKSIGRDGKKISYQTSAIVFGEAGTNGQHSFYQLLHQGTRCIPCDFIGFSRPSHQLGIHHQILMANMFAQAEALMKGKTSSEVLTELKEKGMSDAEIHFHLPYRVFKGNRPSNTFLLEVLTPFNLGMLIAAYEHKTFVQGILWNIYSFDQWGVELGKQLAKNIGPELEGREKVTSHDSSTNGLINQYKKWKSDS